MEKTETTEVAIVGAGPAGLTLALSLARFHIRSVVLEKEQEITSDPRGVYLTGDAVRILHLLGLGDQLSYIGHEVDKVHFHQTSFSSKPFFSLRIGSSNSLEQVVPEGILQIQPRLESVLRSKVQESPWCILRKGCTVTARLSEDPPTIEYVDHDNETHRLTSQWLVGADGKAGVVRKHFLEPSAGIRQEYGTYPYDGTWVAANLRISLPTRQSHPEFPLWNEGYTPDDVYDLFWPKGWHFCSPPGKATAAGRFGPHEERLWRHEFRQDDIDDSVKSEELLWEHITPMISRERDNQGYKLSQLVTYPRDCITILRCRPYRFTHKVVNRWFDKRTILIGDAAHVFPPFAGQGIASGFRDAHQLAWRLSLLVHRDSSNAKDTTSSQSLLTSWALERRRSVDDAAFFSMLNGRLCNKQTPLWALLVLKFQMFLDWAELFPRRLHPQNQKERRGFAGTPGGFFVEGHDGGVRMAQINMWSTLAKTPILSDVLLERSPSVFTLLIMTTSAESDKFYDVAKKAIVNARLDASVLSEESIVLVSPHIRTVQDPQTLEPGGMDMFYPYCPRPDDGLGGHGSYDASAYVNRLGRFTRFAIVRPDLFIFACARSTAELAECLRLLGERLNHRIE